MRHARFDPWLGKRLCTFSPGIKQLTQTLSNRDFAGRRIVEFGSPSQQKLAQYLEYSMGNLVSPYGTFNQFCSLAHREAISCMSWGRSSLTPGCRRPNRSPARSSVRKSRKGKRQRGPNGRAA
jgi:hypothetical protein